MDDHDDMMRAMGFPVQFAGRVHAKKHPSKRPKGDNGTVPQAFVSPWFVSDSKRGHWLEECFASKSGAAAEEKGRNLHDEALTQQLYEIKEQFDSIPPDVFWRSRAATNPYERIGHGPFVCRSALKLVEMDAVAGVVRDDSRTPLSWVDVCGGPGGFSEYIQWRCAEDGRACRGWGITLRDTASDWQLDESEAFTMTYGKDGTGDIYKECNLKHLAELVRREVPDGVGLVLSDGGFPDARNRHDQALAMRQLVLGQMTAMAMVLREGGTWVCKASSNSRTLQHHPQLFAMHDEFTAGLYALAAHVFNRVCIIKPCTSRPASAERYIICEGLHQAYAPALVQHLFAINADFTHQDALRVRAPVPSHLLHADTAFISHLRAANCALQAREVIACDLLLRHAQGERCGVSHVDTDTLLQAWGVLEPHSVGVDF